MNTDAHPDTVILPYGAGGSKIFFNKNRICGEMGISVYQCKSVANSGMLGWVLEKQNKNSVVKYGEVSL